MKLFSKKQRKSKVDSEDKGFEVKKEAKGIMFTIVSDTIHSISPTEVDNIVKIVIEELEHVCVYTGQYMAQRIVEESGIPEITTASVNGGMDGTEWLIKISIYPLEFID